MGVSAWFKTVVCSAMLWLSACTPPASYTTQLTASHGLSPSDPVTYHGARIGEVDSVSPQPNGSSLVGFTVDGDHRSLVRDSSIMIPEPSGSTTALTLYDSDTTSPAATPGSAIRGADNQAAANAMIVGAGLTSLSSSLAALTNLLNNSSANTPATTNTINQTNAQAQQLQQQILQLNQAATGAAANNLAVINQEAQALQKQYNALQQQLAAQGNTAEARHLQQELDKLNRTLGATPSTAPSPGSAAPPNTLTVPPASSR